MKHIFSAGVGKLLLVLLGLIIAGYFAWNMYFFGYTFGQYFLATVPEGQYLLGYLTAGVMAVAILISFFYKEHLKEKVEAYEASRGDGTFTRALNIIVWTVAGIELFSVVFRWIVLSGVGEAGLGWVILGFGVFALVLEWCVGKITHAVANAPAEVMAANVMDNAERMLWGKAPKLLKHMGAEDLRNVAAGDVRPFDQVMNAQQGDKIQKESAKDIRVKKQQGRMSKARQVAANFLAPRNTDPTPELIGSNGHAPSATRAAMARPGMDTGSEDFYAGGGF